MTAATVVAPGGVGALARVLGRRYGDRQWDIALRATGVFGLVAIPVALFVPAAEPYLLLVVATVWMRGPAAPFLPVALEPVLMLYGRLHPPLIVTLVAATASAFAEVVSLEVTRGVVALSALDRVRGTVRASRVMRLFDRQPFAAVALAAISPIPDWITRSLAAVAGYPLAPYVAADTLGRIPKLWLAATLGAALHLPAALLGTVAGASVLLAALVPIGRWVLVHIGRGARAPGKDGRRA